MARMQVDKRDDIQTQVPDTRAKSKEDEPGEDSILDLIIIGLGARNDHGFF